jgi:TRAP-type mannitol/chloroaromatic compound transport system permease large subunit
MIIAAQLSLLPIVPLLLLPFALIFFVIVFPIWGVALGVVGLALLLVRGLNKLSRGRLARDEESTYKVFRWVLTFGGIARLAQKKPAVVPSEVEGPGRGAHGP